MLAVTKDIDVNFIVAPKFVQYIIILNYWTPFEYRKNCGALGDMSKI